MKKTFSKEERLCSNRLIATLFAEGKSFQVRPFRIRWLRLPAYDGTPVKVLFSVPKHQVRMATDRNLVRRRMREAFRLNKQDLYDRLAGKEVTLIVSVTYATREIEAYPLIESKIILLLQRLTEENEKVTG